MLVTVALQYISYISEHSRATLGQEYFNFLGALQPVYLERIYLYRLTTPYCSTPCIWTDLEIFLWLKPTQAAYSDELSFCLSIAHFFRRQPSNKVATTPLKLAWLSQLLPSYCQQLRGYMGAIFQAKMNCDLFSQSQNLFFVSQSLHCPSAPSLIAFGATSSTNG